MPKKLLKISIFLLLLGGFAYRYFFYIDIPNKCFIKIKPSVLELSTINVKEGIKILKRVTPEEYEKLCKHVKAISPNFSCGGLGGGCYQYRNLENKEIDISVTRDTFLGQTAAVIAHETCHAIQHQEGRSLNEQECYEVDDQVFRAVVKY